VIALVDYGAGNLTSVRKALAALDARYEMVSTPAGLEHASAVIVPGVGHFAATRQLDAGMHEALRAAAAVKPLLGICLGLQFLFDGSDEAPEARGLTLLRGTCQRLLPTAKVPHVGWNTVDVRRPSRILTGIASGTSFYFTHSYAAPVTDACVGETTYTMPFAAVVESGNVFGVQFHPEKSGDAGLRVLHNFLEASRC
jgi:glutamine amidotransferase